MGVEFLSMLEASFYSTFRIIFISFCGYLLVRSKIIDKQVMKGIAEMTANFLIPCLSVAEICKSFNISKYEIWLPILIYCIFSLGIGYLIGEIICFFFPLIKPEIRRLVLIACMFSNSTSMQLIYVDSLGSILGKMINSTETEAKSRGYVIVLLYTIFVNFFRWSIGFNLMKPDKKSQSYFKNLEKINYESSPEISVETYRNGIIDMETREVSISTGEGSSSLNEMIKKEKFESFIKIIKEGINMPFIAGVGAIFLASIPYVNTFFSDKNSLGFKLLIESCEAVGKCVSTFVILILGLNLSISLKDNNDGTEPLDKKIIAYILFAKALIFPTIGLFAIWFFGFKSNIITDPLLCFLLLTNFCTPTAINMITIAIINKFQVNNLSQLLIYQYIMGILTVTMWTAIYMNLFI